MLSLLLACLNSNGTVVGNPGTSSKYDVNIQLAESEGFQYAEASFSLDAIEYYDNSGLLRVEDHQSTIDVIEMANQLSLREGTYTALRLLFSSGKPFHISYAHDEIGSGELNLSISELSFEQQEIVITGPTILKLGQENWLTLDNVQNQNVLEEIIQHTSNIYPDTNANGTLDEGEEERPLISPTEEESYVLQGTWIADSWTYRDRFRFENVSLNLSPDGYLFQSDRRINIETNETIAEDIVRCAALQYPDNINREGHLPLFHLSGGDSIGQASYAFLDANTLLLNYIDASDTVQNVVYRAAEHRPISFDISLPETLDVSEVELYNISMGSFQDPVHTTEETLTAKACLPEHFSADISDNNPNALVLRKLDTVRSDIWVGIPPTQIDTITLRGRSEVHLAHNDTWNNLSLSNYGTRTVSYAGNAETISVENENSGQIYLFGTAQSFTLQTGSEAGAIHAFDFPAHRIDLSLSHDEDTEIHLSPQENTILFPGVYGTMSGAGILKIVQDMQTTDSTTVEIENTGSGEIVQVCLEDVPPESCERYE